MIRTASAAMALVFAFSNAVPAFAQTRQPIAPALPQEMLGSWGRESTDCTDSESEGRLHVTLRALEFIDSRITIARVAGPKDGWWRIEGSAKETGKRRTQKVSLELKMQGSEKLNLRNGPEKPEEFVRCKPAQLQG